MIAIQRGPIPAGLKVYAKKSVKALDGVTLVTKWEQELEKALAHFADPQNYVNDQKLTKVKFSFTVYKDAELAKALEAIFGKKCAYCESRFAHVMPKDIEHFRPKSEITTGAGTLQPGYYWLAGEWDNLLVSCADCNRARNHQVPGQTDRIKLGKETQFPLSDETKRVRSQGSLAAEEAVRLLLNPCTDAPEMHLMFDEQGLIVPRPNGVPSPMGAASITVYALQRKVLVEERLVVLDRLKFLLQDLNSNLRLRAELLSGNTPAPALDINSSQIRAIKEQLQLMLAPGAPYLGMLRDFIRRSKQRGDFANLLQFGIDPEGLI